MDQTQILLEGEEEEEEKDGGKKLAFGWRLNSTIVAPL